MQKLGFGFMRLPLTDPDDYESIDLETTKQMVDMFLERGFTYFDTAYMYHNGQSEIAMREALVKRHPRARFLLADKMPIMSVKKTADLERIFNEQLQRCNVDYFDIYHLHNLGVENYRLAQQFEAFGFIAQKKREGKIRHLGFSYHDHAPLLDEILTAHPEVEVVQLQLNYLDWENDSIQSRRCYETARKHNKRIIVMEPVKGGTLATVPEKAEQLFKQYAPDMSVTSWAVRYAASLEGVETVLSGMSDMAQLQDNTGYMQVFKPLSEAELAVVKAAVKIIDEAIAIPCTACQYCVEYCPQRIAIHKYFALYNNHAQSKPVQYSLQQVYYDNRVKEGHGKASDCIECAACEKQCPQQLKIIDLLKDVAKVFDAQQ